MVAVQTFIGQINSRFIIPQLQDKLIWKVNVSRVFLVKDYFNSMEEVPSCAAPIKILWNPQVPSKIGFFIWDAWWGKVLTSSQLKKRGFHLASKCPFYGKKEEIWGQWTDLLSAFGASRVPPFLV